MLVLTEYPPSAAGLATQGHLMCRGLREIGVDVHPVHLESPQEKEWYYRWFAPDVVVGIGYWGHTPPLVVHPQEHGMTPVPWLVADGCELGHAALGRFGADAHGSNSEWRLACCMTARPILIRKESRTRC